MAIDVLLGAIAKLFLETLAGEVSEATRWKVESDGSRQAVSQAVAASIHRYASQGNRLALAQPLLRENGLLFQPPVVDELLHLVRFDRSPDPALVGARWRAAIDEPPQWRDFTEEASLFLDYFQAALSATEVYRPAFAAKSLDDMAQDGVVSADELTRIERQLSALSELVGAPFGRLTNAYARVNSGIRDHIRDFSRLVEEKTRDFVGRRFVFDAAAQFMAENPRGYFLVRGEPGIGKTAIAAQIVRSEGYVHHFNIRAEGINTPAHFLSNICSQLIAVYDLPYSMLPPEATRDAGFLNRLLGEVSDRLPAGEKGVIVIDALDEAEQLGQSAGVNTLYLPLRLPPSIYIIATMRPEAIPFRIEGEQRTLDIEQDADGNMADIREYVTLKASSSGIQEYVHSQPALDLPGFIDRLVAKSQGNFMYLYYVLPEIERGAYQAVTLDTLPIGLQNYYQDHWRRMRGQDEEAWFAYKLPIVMAVTVVKEPVSIDLIAEFSGVEQLARIRSVLRDWDQFLSEEQGELDGIPEKRYRIYHMSFHDFIALQEEVVDEQVSRRVAHQKVISSGWRDLFGDDIEEDSGPDLPALRKQLLSAFNKAQLEDLIFEMGIEKDDLPGETRPEKAREFLKYLNQRGLIPQLLELVRDLRPNIPW